MPFAGPFMEALWRNDSPWLKLQVAHLRWRHLLHHRQRPDPALKATRVTQGGESQARTPAHIRLFRAYATRGQTIHAVHKVLSGESTTIGSPERTPFFRIGWRCRRHIRVVPFYPFRPLLDLVDLTLFRYRVLAVHSILCARRERAFQCAF